MEVSGFRFVPADLTVAAGTTVRFRNEDAAAHTATADDGAFHLALDGSGDEGEITLDTAGTYAYHCALHASMRGSITVN